MSKAESTPRTNHESLNVDFMRSLVKQYSELGQWTSAFFWADAAAAAAGDGEQPLSGDDVWLLASTMLARGELFRAAHTVTSRQLHRRHLLCLGVAMRAYLAAKEPSSALSLLEECDNSLLEPRSPDQTHNRALAGVLVSQARCLCALERREAAAEALAAALRADVACLEALHLLLEQHAYTPRQERELIDSLPFSAQLSPPEAALLRATYCERLQRYAPLPPEERGGGDCELPQSLECVRVRTCSAMSARARRQAGAGQWAAALRSLDALDPWACADVRAVCLLELRRSSELFAFAHTLVDAYPNCWTAWFAVGIYYYLIGKSEFARRYLSKAKSLAPGAGCVWLAYGHSFAADNEHDQAMAAYFKASQLMPGCYLPPLYVGVECSLLNNVSMAQRFLTRAAILHNNFEADVPTDEGTEAENIGGWELVSRVVSEAAVAHEAAAAALQAGDVRAAHALASRAATLAEATATKGQMSSCWGATLDAMGHVCRKLRRYDEALSWHKRALQVRPRRGQTYSAMGLCLALMRREREAADALHTALALEPDDALAVALLDSIVDTLDKELSDEDVPQFPFPATRLVGPPSAAATPAAPSAPGTPRVADRTNMSDMSMSFD